MQVSPQQVYQEVLNQGGSQTQASVAAALVDGIESNGDPLVLSGGRGPAQGLFQFEPGTWTGGAGGGRNGLPSTVGAASWQQQVTGFINDTGGPGGSNFQAWGPDLMANGGDPNSSSNPAYGYTGGPQPGSKVANRIAALNLPAGGGATAGGGGGSAGSASPSGAPASNPNAIGPGNTSVTIDGTTYQGGTTADVSALAQIDSTFGTYGFQGQDLKDLTGWAWGEMVNSTDPTQIAIDFQTPGTQGYKIFEKQFPGFTAANQQLINSGNAAMSVAQYQAYQTGAEQLAKAAGLPPGFINKENIGILAGANVSHDELNSRINDALAVAYNSTPDQQAMFNQYFGVYDSDLVNSSDPMAFGQQGNADFHATGHGPISAGQIAAIALDPQLAEPLIKNQITAAQIGGSYQTAGLTGVDAGTAYQLAQAGITASQGLASANKNAVYAPLQNALPGLSGGQQVTANQLATGDLLGDTNAQRALQVSVESRTAPFKGGGGDVATNKGVVGAGSASGTGSA